MKLVIVLKGDPDLFGDVLHGIAEEVKAESNLSGGFHNNVEFDLDYEEEDT